MNDLSVNSTRFIICITCSVDGYRIERKEYQSNLIDILEETVSIRLAIEQFQRIISNIDRLMFELEELDSTSLERKAVFRPTYYINLKGV